MIMFDIYAKNEKMQNQKDRWDTRKSRPPTKFFNWCMLRTAYYRYPSSVYPGLKDKAHVTHKDKAQR